MAAQGGSAHSGCPRHPAAGYTFHASHPEYLIFPPTIPSKQRMACIPLLVKPFYLPIQPRLRSLSPPHPQTLSQATGAAIHSLAAGTIPDNEALLRLLDRLLRQRRVIRNPVAAEPVLRKCPRLHPGTACMHRGMSWSAWQPFTDCMHACFHAKESLGQMRDVCAHRCLLQAVHATLPGVSSCAKATRDILAANVSACIALLHYHSYAQIRPRTLWPASVCGCCLGCALHQPWRAAAAAHPALSSCPSCQHRCTPRGPGMPCCCGTPLSPQSSLPAAAPSPPPARIDAER